MRELVEGREGFVDVVREGQHVEHLEVRRRIAPGHVDAGADLVEADRLTPRDCNSRASWAPLPFVPGRSGDVQFRSVGPLPAKNTRHGTAPSRAGSESVEGKV